MASVQRRKGPNVVGLWGFLQPIADGLKLVIKEIILPNRANKFLFIAAPAITLFLSFICWVAIPFDGCSISWSFNLTNSILLIFIISSLGVYGILLSGWSSNSKYGLLGSLRSVAQMISYEVSISLCVLPTLLFANSLNLNNIILTQMESTWFVFGMFPLAIIFFISILAETNRAPFDLAEAEAELVAGYNVEYSAFTFAAFFLGEYSNILFMCSLFTCLFFGGGADFGPFPFLIAPFQHIIEGNSIFVLIQLFCFSTKVLIFVFLFIFVRANLPRFRFDQLMFIGWKVFLPISLGFVFFFSGLLFAIKGLGILQLPYTIDYINLSLIRY